MSCALERRRRISTPTVGCSSFLKPKRAPNFRELYQRSAGCVTSISSSTPLSDLTNSMAEPRGDSCIHPPVTIHRDRLLGKGDASLGRPRPRPTIEKHRCDSRETPPASHRATFDDSESAMSKQCRHRIEPLRRSFSRHRPSRRRIGGGVSAGSTSNGSVSLSTEASDVPTPRAPRTRGGPSAVPTPRRTPTRCSSRPCRAPARGSCRPPCRESCPTRWPGLMRVGEFARLPDAALFGSVTPDGVVEPLGFRLDSSR